MKVAIVTPKRISIEYDDGEGYEAHLAAESNDEFIYRGHYGYPKYAGQQRIGGVQFRRFNGKDGRVALLGSYTATEYGTAGVWLSELQETREP